MRLSVPVFLTVSKYPKKLYYERRVRQCERKKKSEWGRKCGHLRNRPRKIFCLLKKKKEKKKASLSLLLLLLRESFFLPSLLPSFLLSFQGVSLTLSRETSVIPAWTRNGERQRERDRKGKEKREEGRMKPLCVCSKHETREKRRRRRRRRLALLCLFLLC